MHLHSRRAFTLIELLVVIAIIAILAVVVILTLNPGQLLKQTRDSNRLSDIQTITSALNLYNSDQGGVSGYSLGTPGIMYLSIPDPTATTTAGTNCAGIGYPAANTSYHCAASSTYRNKNGSGWIPVNFATMTAGSPIGNLPVDPINTTSSCEYYEYGTNGTTFNIEAVPESQKYLAQSPTSFAAGSSLGLLPAYCVTFTPATYSEGAFSLQGLTFDPHTNTIWGTSGSGNNISQINDTTYVTSTYPVAGGPGYITFDSHTNTIWTANAGVGSVTQTNDTTYVSSTASLSAFPIAIAFDSHTNTIWVANGTNNNVTQINDTTYASSTYSVGRNADAIAFDPHTNTIWVANATDQNVTQINDTTYVATNYAVGGFPLAIVFDPHTNSIWAATVGAVTQINDTTYASSTYTIGAVIPGGATFDSHTDSIWIANQSGGTVTQINDTSYVTSTYTLLSSSYGIAFDSHTNTIWFAGGTNFIDYVPSF